MTTMDQVLNDLTLVPPRYPAPRYLTLAELLVSYSRLAAQGDLAATIRLGMLRQRLHAVAAVTPGVIP
jgi:hypothetical protein